VVSEVLVFFAVFPFTVIADYFGLCESAAVRLDLIEANTSQQKNVTIGVVS
jgi:hypothetical protein